MAVVLVNIYTGNLFSYLAVPKLNSIANTFDELADRYPQLQITIEANSVLGQIILVVIHLKTILINIFSMIYIFYFTIFRTHKTDPSKFLEILFEQIQIYSSKQEQV